MEDIRDVQPSPSPLRGNEPSVASHAFSHFSRCVARKSGHITPFIVATLLVILWAITGPIAHFSDTWQLVMNTMSSAVTFLMVFVIQGSQNRDTEAINAKLNEIIRALPDARKEFLNLEELGEGQLCGLNRAFARIGNQASRVSTPASMPSNPRSVTNESTSRFPAAALPATNIRERAR